MKSLLLIMGILCISYYFASVLYGGFGLSIIWIWMIGGVCLMALSLILDKNWFMHIINMIPLWMKCLGKGLFLIGILIMLIVEGAILCGMQQTPPKNLDCIIVLGCKVNGTVPSRALRMRLNTALEYLLDNPETKAILTGGQGDGEEISEALCMKQYLQEAGIQEHRLRIEEESTTTVENLQYSKKYVDDHMKSIGIVTNNFHVFRSVKLAQKQGYKQVVGLPTPTGSLLLVHYMVREGVALMKEFVLGNI